MNFSLFATVFVVELIALVIYSLVLVRFRNMKSKQLGQPQNSVAFSNSMLDVMQKFGNAYMGCLVFMAIAGVILMIAWIVALFIGR
jgi:hypothetical protein